MANKTYVSTSVSRVVDDDQILDPTKAAMIEALFTGKNVADNMLEEALNGSAFKFEQMYRYAKSGQYFYGLPSAKETSEPAAVPLVKDILSDLLGQTVSIEYLKIDQTIPKHFAAQYLQDSYGYDHNTGELKTLSATKGSPVFLKRLLTHVPATSLDDIDLTIVQLEKEIPDFYEDETSLHYVEKRKASQYEWLKRLSNLETSQDLVYDLNTWALERVDVEYTWLADVEVTKQDEEGEDYTVIEQEIQEETFVVYTPTNTQEFVDRIFYQVGYIAADGTYGFWTYEYASGTYPALDRFMDVEYTRDGTYFPFAILRRDFVDRADTEFHETEEFKTTNRLLDFIGIDFVNMSSLIHQNPDIEKVRQAALVMGVPMDTENQLEARYLFDYFSRLSADSDRQPLEFETLTNKGLALINTNSITWADADFSLTLSYHNISNKTVSGTIGKPGEYKVERVMKEYEYTVRTNGKNDKEEARIYKYPVYEIKKQLMGGLCQRVSITNPVAKYDIDYKRSYKSTRDNDILIIPLDYLITKNYKIKDRSMLYTRSLHIVFNAWVRQDLEWYETSLFVGLLFVVSIVVTVLTGIETVSSVYGFMAGLGLTGTALVAATVLGMAALAIGVQETFRLVVKELGIEQTLIVVVVAMIVNAYTGTIQIPMADQLLFLSTNLMSAYTWSMEQEIKAITREGEELVDLANEKQKEIDAALELLDTQDILDPFMFIGKKPLDIVGEGPTAFYNRTIGLGNTADLSYKSIEFYVEASLKLPDIHDSVGGDIYGTS